MKEAERKRKRERERGRWWWWWGALRDLGSLFWES
jgi:hypothetical protein